MVAHYGKYQTATVQTADKTKLLIMLYEGAIKFLKRSAMDQRKGLIASSKTFLGKGDRIISELQTTLDFDHGGDIAKQLNDLYSFMLTELTQANLKNDPNKIDGVVQLLETLLEGWQEAAIKYRQQRGSNSQTAANYSGSTASRPRAGLNLSL